MNRLGTDECVGVRLSTPVPAHLSGCEFNSRDLREITCKMPRTICQTKSITYIQNSVWPIDRSLNTVRTPLPRRVSSRIGASSGHVKSLFRRNFLNRVFSTTKIGIGFAGNYASLRDNGSGGVFLAVVASLCSSDRQVPPPPRCYYAFSSLSFRNVSPGGRTRRKLRILPRTEFEISEEGLA